MKASLLVPVYNREKYLAECLESVVAQQFDSLEILIADDASTDSSPDIIKQFAARDSRIRWWRNPRNLGLTPNTNKMLKEARGEYVKFVHSDDKLLSPFAIQKMAAVLDKNPNAAIVSTKWHQTGTDHPPLVFRETSTCIKGRDMIVECFERNGNCIGTPTFAMFRRLQAQRGFDERFTVYMDWELWNYLLQQGDYEYLAEQLVTWRVHNDQSSSTNLGYVERPLFIEVCLSTPWFRELATDKMLFTMIYYLRRDHGDKVLPLTRELSAQLPAHRYYRLWLERKFSQAVSKLQRKWDRKRAKRTNSASRAHNSGSPVSTNQI
jgi:glycosyltransferase involved in cell wall biosynthesis